MLMMPRRACSPLTLTLPLLCSELQLCHVREISWAKTVDDEEPAWFAYIIHDRRLDRMSCTGKRGQRMMKRLRLLPPAGVCFMLTLTFVQPLPLC